MLDLMSLPASLAIFIEMSSLQIILPLEQCNNAAAVVEVGNNVAAEMK